MDYERLIASHSLFHVAIGEQLISLNKEPQRLCPLLRLVAMKQTVSDSRLKTLVSDHPRTVILTSFGRRPVRGLFIICGPRTRKLEFKYCPRMDERSEGNVGGYRKCFRTVVLDHWSEAFSTPTFTSFIHRPLHLSLPYRPPVSEHLFETRPIGC